MIKKLLWSKLFSEPEHQPNGLQDADFAADAATSPDIPVNEPETVKVVEDQCEISTDTEDEQSDINTTPAEEISPEDISSNDKVRRLTKEQEEKQRLADEAIAAAAYAETERMLAQYNVELEQAEKYAAALQISSTQAQEVAAVALRELSEAEQSYAVAQSNLDRALQEKKHIVDSGEEKLAALAAEYAARAAVINEDVTEMEKSLAESRFNAETALNEGNSAEAMIEDVEAELRRINVESAEELQRAEQCVADLTSELEMAEKRISLFETKLASEQNDFDEAAARFEQSRDRLQTLGSRVDAVRAEEETLLRELQEDADSLNAAIDEQINNLQLNHDQIEKQLRAHNETLEKAQNDDAELVAAQKECSEQLRLLKIEREEAERNAKTRISRISEVIDEARSSVINRKEEYLAAQKEVEATTAELVRLNAVAKRAKDAADKAQQELKDAESAASMVIKLKSDATAAKDMDESSAQLLNKAEMVLVTTIERATKLVEEKKLLIPHLEMAVTAASVDAEKAASAAEAATASANDKIVRWLAAEEELVSTAANVERDKELAKQEMDAESASFDARITDLMQELDNFEQQRITSRQAIDEAEEMRQDSMRTLQGIKEQLDEMQRAADKELQQNRQEAEQKMAKWRANLADEEERFRLAEEECERIGNEHEKKTEEFSRMLALHNTEREELNQETAVKRDELAEAKKKAEDCEKEYKAAITSLNERLEQLHEDVRFSRAAAADEAEKLRLTKNAYADASAALEECNNAAADAEQQVRAEIERELQPLERDCATFASEKQSLAMELNRRRVIAEQAVRAAAERFNERLEAVNAVAVKKVENEIRCLREQVEELKLETEKDKYPLDEVEARYAEVAKDADLLREQEQQIAAEADAKIDAIETQKAGELNLIDQELQQFYANEESKRSEVKDAYDLLRAAEDEQRRLVEIRNEAELAGVEQQKQAASLFAELQEQYDRDLAAAVMGMDDLQAETEKYTAVVDAADVRRAEAQKQYRDQLAITEELRQQEQNLPVETAALIDELIATWQVQVDTAKSRLSVLEEREAELKRAYTESSNYADRSRQAKEDIEYSLRQMQDDEENNKLAAAQEIADLNARTEALRADADEKEQRFREIERTLLNSSVLIKEAEAAYEDTKITEARALAELQAAQAARETAMHLAQQTKQAFETMDEATAEIMRHASEDLFVAVESANVLVEEKQQTHNAVWEKLNQTEKSLAAIKQAVGEAPQQMEQMHTLWQQAEDDFRNHKQQSDSEIPAINRRLSRFLANRKKDQNAAEQKLAKCELDVHDGVEKMEQLSRQLMDAAAEISMAVLEVQNAETAAADALHTAEGESECQLRELHSRREDAEQKLVMFKEQLQQADEAMRLVHEEASPRLDACRKRQEQYDNACAELNEKLNKAKAEICAASADASQTIETASAEADQAVVATEQAAAVYSQLTDELNQLAELTAEAENRRDAVQTERQHLLKLAEEEKLRILGAKTIARIAAEDRTSQAEMECTALKAKYVATVKRSDEMQAALAAAEERLRQLTAKSEEAMSATRQQTEDLVQSVSQMKV